MSLPTSITDKSHYDAGGDDPKQARAQLSGLHDDVETINDHLKQSPLISPATPLGIGDGLEAASGKLRAKLDSNPGLARAAAGMKLDINALVALTSPAVADLLGVYDADAAANKAITLANALKVINALTADAAPDGANDYVVTYDADAAAAKKVLLDDLGSSGFAPISLLSPSAAASAEVTGIATGSYVAYRVVSQLEFDTDSQALRVQIGDGSYETGSSYNSAGNDMRVGEVNLPAWEARTPGTLKDAWQCMAMHGQIRTAATVYEQNLSILDILFPDSTEAPIAFERYLFTHFDSNPFFAGYAVHMFKGKTKVDRIKFMTRTGNFTGQIHVFGLKKAS